MIYAYEIEGGKVALDHKPPRYSTPYIEIEELPAGPRDSLRIVKGKLVSNATIKRAINAKAKLAVAKQDRDDSLDALVHDFGDGRVMQIRPKDDQFVKGAIDLMEMAGITSMDNWVMLDDRKYTVTVDELKAARMAGLLSVSAIFSAYAI
tara:strand:+ start:4231 stop:4680 length:450 start_codon:yes stop_codon:yes gene_type:complete